MKKNKLYRVGAAFMAALMVFTCMPQTSLYALAETTESTDSGSLDEGTDAEISAVSVEAEETQAQSGDPTAEPEEAQPSSQEVGEGDIAPQDDNDPPAPPAPVVVLPTGIRLDHETLSIQKKDSAKLTATVEPADATNKTVIWSSSNPDVASVTSDGTVVTASTGVTMISATTHNGVPPATCLVTVTPIPVKNVIVDPSSLEMEITDTTTKKLSVTVLPVDADDKSVKIEVGGDKNVEATYNETTKEISVKNLATPKSGRATIKVISKDNLNAYANCTVLVNSKNVKLEKLGAANYPKIIYEGESVNLSPYVTYEPANVSDRNLTWAVASDSVNYVSVDERGRVTVKALAATDDNKTATVTATSSATLDTTVTGATNKATFTITVKRKNVALQSLIVKQKEVVLEDDGANKSYTIDVQLNPYTSTERTITAKISGGDAAKIVAGQDPVPDEDPDSTASGGTTPDYTTAEATADASGHVYFTVTAKKLTGLNKQAACVVTFKNAKAGGKGEAVCNVTVNKYVTPVDSLNLDPTTLEITDGTADGKPLTATITPLTAENRDIVWEIDDPEVLSIVGPDADGKTTATETGGVLSSTVTIKPLMVGTCKVTATAAGDVKKTCTVTVTKHETKPATSLKITYDGIADDGTTQTVEATEITLKPGDTFTLKPTVNADAANKKVRWSSSSSAVASVTRDESDNSCTVTANATGDCTITAQASGTAADCTKTVTVHVKKPYMVVDYPEDWSLTPDMLPITEAYLKENLTVTFYPIDKPMPEQDKKTLDGSAYQLKIIGDENTEHLYKEEDMEKPGVKILVVTYTYKDVSYRQEIPVTMEEFAEATLIGVTPLSGEESEIWNVPNGTPLTALPLAKTTEITVRGVKSGKIARVDAVIKWDLAGSGYNPSKEEEQEFTVIGEVVLPDYVKNEGYDIYDPESEDTVIEHVPPLSLRVQARVHVREYASSGKQTERPVFFLLNGVQITDTAVTAPYGSKIVIASPTEEAEIYYMVDRRPDEVGGIPQNEEHRYRSPIELTKKTTTIYAIATKYGYDDSECSECTFRLVQADPIDPDDLDDPLPNDVTDEDKKQIGGKVPNGLWAVIQYEAGEEDGFAYTGSAIKPAVHVYDRTMLLTEKKDYTVAYKNNTNAGSAQGSANPPTITVTGKGNYEGKAVVNFTIKPQSIVKDEGTVTMDEYVAVAYTGKEQNPNPILSWNGKKLSKNKDYTCSGGPYTGPGTYSVTVTGTGNYTGKRTMNYEIYQGGVPVSKLTISKIADQKYTGSEIKPTVTVKNKNVPLIAGTEKSSTGNYWIKYENCTKVGTASIVIVGKGGYKGSKRINFKILPTANINKAGITLDVPAAGTAYTGKRIEPACTVNYLGTVLKKDTDYKISYSNNINTGTATVTLTGIGAYAGTAKKTFKILANDISGLAAQLGGSYAYEKGGCKPKPVVTFNGVTLKEGTDYTLTYRNNNKIGNTAGVTIKGKGNYKGQIVRYFAVTMQDISNLQVVAKDKAYQQRANIYKTTVQVIDLNGMALTAGTDYSKDFVYTYADGTKEGEPVLSTDIIPMGTRIRVEVRVTNPRCYIGTAYGTYRIVQASIAGAKVSISPQEYTGRQIKLKKSQIQITLNDTPLGEDSFEIVGYENNVNQGTAKVTLRGTGSYGGTKTVNFKIKKKGILSLIF